jgi:hypothetical protein
VGSPRRTQAGEHRRTDDGDPARGRLGRAAGGETRGARNVGGACLTGSVVTCDVARLGSACRPAGCTGAGRTWSFCGPGTDLGSSLRPGRASRRQRPHMGRTGVAATLRPGAVVGRTRDSCRAGGRRVGRAIVGSSSGGAARVGSTATRGIASACARSRSRRPFMESSGRAFLGRSPACRRRISRAGTWCDRLGCTSTGRDAVVASDRGALVGGRFSVQRAAAAVGVDRVGRTCMGHSEDRGARRTAGAFMEPAPGRRARARLGHPGRAGRDSDAGSSRCARTAAVERSTRTGVVSARDSCSAVDRR